jgi:23S rRNA pseudouridine2605 synthase
MPTERTPRQPRKPFQNAGKKERSPGPDKRRTGRSDSRAGKSYVPKERVERPSKPRLKKERPFSSGDEGDRPAKSFIKKERPFPAREDGERPAKSFIKKERPFPAREDGERPAKSFYKKDRPGSGREDGDRPSKPRFKSERPFPSKEGGYKGAKPGFKRERPYSSEEDGDRPVKRRITSERPYSAGGGKKYATRSGVRIKASDSVPEGIRLNKFIANSGICSRREADELIKAGVIKINGTVVSEVGSKVMPGDKVQYGDQTLNNEKKRYLLLNKQKGYVTTTKDPHAKNTVMELIAGACKERIYPVGRLDRNTTGLLLFTNDGEIAKKLMHPRSRIKKMYHVVLDQPVSKADMLKIADGMHLDGEKVEVDSIAYVEDAPDRREIGMEIHSGQNRVIRRMFESLGYKVTKLDRVMYAGLTKRNLPRTKWRFLTEKEVISLIMMK